MLARLDTSADLGNNSVDLLQWNSTHHSDPPHYAAQFPYAVVDESFLRHLLNFTITKGETMHAMFDNNRTGLRPSQAVNDSLNYEMCSVSHDTESAWFSTQFQATLHFMYITIFLIAIFGNGIVCFIVCTSSRMQTVTNFFIANLALSDMVSDKTRLFLFRKQTLHFSLPFIVQSTKCFR